VDGDPSLPVGTLLLRNSTGPLRLGYGAWRDLLLGAQFTDGRGELVSVGGRVVKNVAGYDVTKFLAGSYGCFGTPVTITTRTYRRPAGAVVATLPPDVAAVGKLMTTPLRPQYAILTRDALTLGYLGDAAALAYYSAELPKLEPKQVTERRVDEDIAARAALWASATEPRGFRASVPPAKVPAFVAASGLTNYTADAAFGIVVGPTNDAGAVTTAARDVGGSCVCFDEHNRPLPAGLDPVQAGLLRRLKDALDPESRLPALPVA
jgi:glycolate oxidase FAD binding subunit